MSTFFRPRRIAGASLALALLSAGVALPQAASAAPAALPGPTTITATGAFSGTVPAGACYVDAEVLGGAGGKAQAFAFSNGAGARISGTFAVTPGESYSGAVGGGGASVRTAGINGGGLGGVSDSSTHPGAGGGGYTELLFDGDLAVLAGGGGGSSGGHTSTTEGFGGTGGLPVAGGYASGEAGTNGFDNPASNVVGGGAGGTGTAAGAGGVHSTDASRNGFAASGRTGGTGGNDVNADTGGGGGGGVFGGGGGASTVAQGSPVTGAGGGGGSSFIDPAAEDITAVAGPKRAGDAQGAGDNGSVSLTWIGCDYDLALTKSVSATNTTIGDTITWTVVIENLGPDAMTKGDTVTLTDSLPGAGAKTITGIAVTGGSNTELERGAFACDTAIGGAMPTSLECGRPYQPVGGAVSGTRGLDVNETLTVTYTQTASNAHGTELENTATVTDTATGDTNDSDTATTTVVADPPVASNDSDLGNELGAAVSLNVLINDTVANGPGTVTLYDPIGNTPISAPYVVPGEGTWTVAGGVVTFTPEAGFEGDPTPVTYQVTDSNGLTDTATVTVTFVPEAVNDVSAGNVLGSTVVVNVLGNDNGDMDPTSVRILNPLGEPTNELVVPGEGTWTVNTTTGAITFVPQAGFVGNPTPITYEVTDTTGDTVEADVTVVYTPEADNDSSTGNTPGEAVTVDVIGNDTGVFDPTSVVLIDPVTGDRVTELVVDGEGTWTVNPSTGAITFTPFASFSGNPTPVTYEVTDLDGNVTSALVTITYAAAPDSLAITGADVRAPMVAAGGLLFGGLLLLALGRRRKGKHRIA